MKGICVNFLDQGLFSIPLGTLLWQPIMAKFRNGFEYRKSDLEMIKGTIFATFCTILGKDRSTNPKDHAGSLFTFWDETAKIDISYQISQQILD